MIYAIIVTYNQNVNQKTVNFAKKHRVFPIIFDNSTVIDIQKQNKEYCLKNDVAYETLNCNCGLPKAYNFVIAKYLKDDDWIILLDQDTLVTEEYFEKVNLITENPNSSCYFAFFKYGKNSYGPKVIKNIKKITAKKTKETKHLNNYLIGINSCTLISKKVFNKIGLFNENLFMYYVDSEFCKRLAENKIQSETIDILIEQVFFTKTKNNYKKIKRRLSHQLMDLYVFSKTLKVCGLSKFFFRLKEKTKFAILYSLKNNIFWFLPLWFVRRKGNNHID